MTLNYPIIIGSGLLQDFPLDDLPRASNLVLITDDTVRELYGNALAAQLEARAQAKVHLFSIPPGEASKSREQKARIEDAMLSAGCTRDTLILALGGGVVGDLSGYIAATFMRGIPFVQVPTTLLAMVDSSVGGKTAINTPHGKNLIGAFHQPVKVLADVDTLQTLAQEQIQAGLIEAVKMFLTHDAEALQLPHDDYVSIIQKAVDIKSGVVARDERERGERALLNLGHTVGHALEKLSDFKLLHGYAVGLGILVEAKLAELQGHLDETGFATVDGLMASLGIKKADLAEYSPEQILEAIQLDKKARAGKARYVVLTQPGATLKTEGQHTHPFPEDLLAEALSQLTPN